MSLLIYTLRNVAGAIIAPPLSIYLNYFNNNVIFEK